MTEGELHLRIDPGGATCTVLLGVLFTACAAGHASAQSVPAGAPSPGPAAHATPDAPAPGVTLAHTELRAITSTRIGQRYGLMVSLPGDRLRSGGGSVRLDVSVGEEEPGVAPIAAFAARVDAARLPNVTHRFTVYRGENHNSVRLASFPSGLYWVYRPAGSP